MSLRTAEICKAGQHPVESCRKLGYIIQHEVNYTKS